MVTLLVDKLVKNTKDMLFLFGMTFSIGRFGAVYNEILEKINFLWISTQPQHGLQT